MPNTGSEAIDRGDMHECWAMLPAIAAVTERVRLGSLVAPTSVHHPAVLANRAATIDHISDGRLVLGIGAGWQINEHHAYGIELEPPATRVDRFEEAIQIVRSLFDERAHDVRGDALHDHRRADGPKPMQSPLPILVGTASPRMLRITATHADEWNTWGAPELAGAGVDEAASPRANAVGRDPASMRTCAQALVFVTDDADRRRAKVRAGAMAERTIVGSIDQIVERGRRLRRARLRRVHRPRLGVRRRLDTRHGQRRRAVRRPHRRPRLSAIRRRPAVATTSHGIADIDGSGVGWNLSWIATATASGRKL